jgi:hypothetical protein
MCQIYSSIHTLAFVYTVTYHFSPPDLTLFTALPHSLSSPIGNYYIQWSIASVTPLETGRCNTRPGFDDLNEYQPEMHRTFYRASSNV